MWPQIIFAIVMLVVAVLLRPRIKTPSQASNPADWENPTNDAGAPIGVIFGAVMIKDPNVLWYGQKNIITGEVEA